MDKYKRVKDKKMTVSSVIYNMYYYIVYNVH